MSATISRRTLAAALAVAPVAAIPAAALPGAHPDAELLALERALCAACHAHDAAEARHEAIWKQIDAASGPRPDTKMCTQAQYNSWRDRRERAVAEYGAHWSFAETRDATSEMLDIACKIIATPANTLAGLRVKALAIDAATGSVDTDVEADNWQSIAADIRRIAGQVQS